MTDPLPLVAHPGQRIAVLVDTGDLYHAARQRGGARIDYRQLLERIVAGRTLVRAIAFAVRGEGVDNTPFLDALRGAGFETRVKVLRRRLDGTLRGDQQVGITLAAAGLADRVDAVALASGDGDLVELVEHLQARQVRVEVYGVEGGLSPALERADVCVAFGDDWMLPGRRDE
ncbi:MAG: NYN domain-containing protein [Myxococcales bacterium]|nr:NYN domain-containing protein [Myxococcales bacterium]